MNFASANEPNVIGLDDQLIHLLRRAHQRASAIFTSAVGEQQLTPAQFFAMARLSELGPLSQNRLGRLAAMDPATIQGVIRRLGQRGIIERSNDPGDKRRTVVRLTPQGEEILEKVRCAALNVNESLLKPLSQQEREQFITLLKRLI